MSANTIVEHQARVTAAAAAGHRLHLGVTLSFVGGGSDKFWTGVLVGTKVAVNFGPHMATWGPEPVGQSLLHRDPTIEAAAARMWSLLRSKTGKGYAVVDAALMVVPAARLHNEPNDRFDHWAMIEEWNRLREARHLNPMRMPYEPNSEQSPRTGKAGGQVLLALTDPATPGEEVLEIWDSAPTERFLPFAALTHPNCPEEARFLAALSGKGMVNGLNPLG